MKFSETVKVNQPELVVTKRHEAWMTREAVYGAAAIGFMSGQLSKRDRIRAGTVSASSLGTCLRAQQFTYLGMPQIRPDTQSLARMQTGSFMHLKWQMEGLSAGWLKAAEVPVGINDYDLHGTMDGILYDDSILELKSINANGFSRVMTFGPLKPHLWQMATYLLCTGRTSGVFVYENKDNQEYREIVLPRSDLPITAVREMAELLWNLIRSKTLVEPLEKCLDREGWEYNYCPYRDRCLSIHAWEEVR